jgi:hypothetical protein
MEFTDDWLLPVHLVPILVAILNIKIVNIRINSSYHHSPPDPERISAM